MNQLILNNSLKSMLSHLTAIGLVCFSAMGNAAVSLDRTRIIFNGSQDSTTVAISNKNTKLPFLAQSWIENEQEEKISSPLLVTPPLQRLEPGQSSQIRIQTLPQIKDLAQDKETLFYFNLREVPPKSEKPNVMQIALQSKIKLFYRPESLMLTSTELINNPWQAKLLLIKQNGKVIAKNPTPYFTTILGVSKKQNGTEVEFKEFKVAMIAPFSESTLSVDENWLGSAPILTYINDYGGRPKLQYQCGSTECHVSPSTQIRE